MIRKSVEICTIFHTKGGKWPGNRLNSAFFTFSKITERA